MECKIKDLKSKCQVVLGNAIIAGKIVRGNCSVCGTDQNIEAHHADYTRPLNVVFYCKKHHAEYHKNNEAPKKIDKIYIADSEVCHLRIKTRTMDFVREYAQKNGYKYNQVINIVLGDWAKK